MLKNEEMFQVPNYRSAKSQAKDYQDAKSVFRKLSHSIGLGHWIRKPVEIEQFKS